MRRQIFRQTRSNTKKSAYGPLYPLPKHIIKQLVNDKLGKKSQVAGTFKIEVNAADIDHILGRRRPNHHLFGPARDEILKAWIAQFVEINSVDVSYSLAGRNNIGIYSIYVGEDRFIRARTQTVQDYKTMSKIENAIEDLKALRPSKWQNFLPLKKKNRLHQKYKFCIDGVSMTEFFQWSKRQDIKWDEYSIFTRYDRDTTIAFDDESVATAFKIEFAEHV